MILRRNRKGEIDWTTEAIAAVRAAWVQTDPMLTKPQIADRFGTTTLAIAGCARRFGFPKRSELQPKPEPARPVVHPERARAGREPLPAFHPLAAVGLGGMRA